MAPTIRRKKAAGRPKVLKEHDEFYRAQGMCISRWAYVDRNLFNLFHAALGIDEIRTSIIYFRAMTLGPQLQLTDQIVSATIEMIRPSAEAATPLDHYLKSVEKNWSAVEQEMRLRLIPFRNILCHEQVSPQGIAIPVTTGEGYARVVRFYSQNSWTQIESRPHKPPRKEKPPGPYKIEDLRAHYQALLKIEGRLQHIQIEFLAIWHLVSREPSAQEGPQKKKGS